MALVDAVLADDSARSVERLRAAIASEPEFASWLGSDASDAAPRLVDCLLELLALHWSTEDRNDNHASPNHAALWRLRDALFLRAQANLLTEQFDDLLDHAKLCALAEFAAGAGHEMNNPLAVISGRAQLLLRGETDEARRADLALIKAQATRVHEMIADLMLFARPPAPVMQATDLVQLIRDSVAKLREAADQKHAQIILKLPDVTVSAMVDEAQLCVVIRALVENAVNAVEDRGRITVELDETPERIQLIVRDNGPGISADERGLIFDPYYSGRQAGRGLGMGLPKCWRIVQQHGGQLTVGEAAGGGAEFVIAMPVDEVL